MNFVARVRNVIGNRSSVYLGLRPQALFLCYLGISISAVLPLFVYAYLGTFARHRGDDYCATRDLLAAGNIIQASITRYLEWSGGYSNLLFIQVGEWFGKAGMIYMAAAAMLMWLIGLTWLIAELGETSGLRWKTWLSVGLAALAIFFSLYRTPNLYTTLFWRSSHVGYLAPLVLMSYLAAFLLHELRAPQSRARQSAGALLIFIGVFFTGGSSETIDALIIGLLLLALLALYLWRRSIRRAELVMFGTALLSAVLSLLVMAFSPGNLVRMKVSALPPPNLFSLGIEVLTYVFQFIVDTFKVSPLPAALSFVIPFLLVYSLGGPLSIPSPQFAGRLKWLTLILPVVMLVAIAFSFAPHAYARGYPSVYVRFPALFILTLTLMAEGCLSAYLLSQVRSPASAFARRVMFGLLILTLLYPVRAAINLYEEEVPKYRAHAAAWDARDAHIRQAVAQGTTDLVVVQLDTLDGVPEYKGNANFWVNACAADFYGLDSLRAP